MFIQIYLNMSFESLRDFIRWEIKLGNGPLDYQLEVIKILLQLPDQITKKKIYDRIGIEQNHAVYEVLKRRSIIEISKNQIKFYSPVNLNNTEKTILLHICETKIFENSNKAKEDRKNQTLQPKLTKKKYKYLIEEFNYWLKSSPYEIFLRKNKEKLLYLQKNSKILKSSEDEFLTLIDKFYLKLGPLTLEYYNFLNKKTGQKLLNLLDDFNKKKSLTNLVQTFESDLHSSFPIENITSILFFLDEGCPIISPKMNKIYEEIKQLFNFQAKLTLRMNDYEKNIKCWNKLLNQSKNSGIVNLRQLQVFCYWYKTFISNHTKYASDSWLKLSFPNYSNFNFTKQTKVISKKGFVILLDALGTKSLNGEKAEERLEQWGKLIAGWPHNFMYRAKFTQIKDLSQMVYFSDTIMIKVERDEELTVSKQLEAIGHAIGYFIIHAMKFKIFFRGCISYGKYVFSDYGQVGEAVTDVGSYFELPNWIGVSLTPNLYKMLMIDKDVKPTFITYDIPTKNGLEPNIVLNIQHIWKDYEENSLHDELVKQLKLQSDQKISLKYRNSIKFIDYVKTLK